MPVLATDIALLPRILNALTLKKYVLPVTTAAV